MRNLKIVIGLVLSLATAMVANAQRTKKMHPKKISLKQQELTTPQGATKGTKRVIRGGSWSYFASMALVIRTSAFDGIGSGYPDILSDDIGFRVVFPANR